ncbi:N-acetylneuraminate synthase family protein [Victivallis vadensis]|uniref:N-acetylneuraminate synthase family protein n=1 Tax=Victivallis vadensis TaxID=172901 RepID=UPI001D284C8D|nr:N-acetylneuraminate synthase family protein [uncultured Victivallis sp.]HJH03081.1 N-acetylneuraminate synthase family protein [Victivallis vadensis]
MTVKIGNREVGDTCPCFIIAEIGINHNGSLELVKELIEVAKAAGCDAVKFQKRTPELSTPPAQRDLLRQTPWGIIPYLEYKKKIELSREDYREIDRYCRALGMIWFASCWDLPSVEFIEQFQPACHKVASAMLTNRELLLALRDTGRPVILSTGMSTQQEIDNAVELLGKERLLLTHSTSSYPCPPAETNLKMIGTLRKRYGVSVGYSGHEVGLQISLAAVALGARLLERHITLDRAMWGSDQAASLEPGGLNRLVRDVRIIETALGDGVKRVYDSELSKRLSLRGY